VELVGDPARCPPDEHPDEEVDDGEPLQEGNRPFFIAL